MDTNKELLTQEGIFGEERDWKNDQSVVTPEKGSGQEKNVHLQQCSENGLELMTDVERDTGTYQKTQKKNNPYPTKKRKEREEDCEEANVKQPGGKKLMFEGKQTTCTIFCKHCMTEHKKQSIERFYKCNMTTCGRLIKDDFRDEDEVMDGEDLKEKDFNDLQRHFHAIEYKFVFDNGPNKDSSNALFKMREKAIAAGILPKDYYVEKYGSNHTMTSAVRAVAQSLERRDATQFRFSFHALMYLIMIGSYTKFDRK